MANRIIDMGLCEAGEIKVADLFETGCRSPQCFNCQGYNHVAKACRSPTQCGFCGEKHATNQCQRIEKGDPKDEKCVNCGKKGHEAWARLCPVRIRQREAAAQKLSSRPRRYETTARKHLELEMREKPRIDERPPKRAYNTTATPTTTTPTALDA